MKPAIAYYRVSTGKQERSGLGIEAQIHAVQAFAAHADFNIIETFTERISGRSKKRPVLGTALDLCRKHKATLVIAKLDRMSRRVAFIANLMEAKVEFVVVSTPTASPFEHHINASFAEKESIDISIRTIAALAAAKRRGVVLGRTGIEIRGPENAAAAIAFAERTRPAIEAIQADGFKTVRAILAEMNRRHVPTFRAGSQWHYCSVYAMLKRLKENKIANDK